MPVSRQRDQAAQEKGPMQLRQARCSAVEENWRG